MNSSQLMLFLAYLGWFKINIILPFAYVFPFFSSWRTGKKFFFALPEGGKGGGNWMQVKRALISQEKLLSFPSIFLHLKSEQTDAEVKKKRIEGKRRKGWISALMKQEHVDIAKLIAKVVVVCSQYPWIPLPYLSHLKLQCCNKSKTKNDKNNCNKNNNTRLRPPSFSLMTNRVWIQWPSFPSSFVCVRRNIDPFLRGKQCEWRRFPSVVFQSYVACMTGLIRTGRCKGGKIVTFPEK